MNSVENKLGVLCVYTFVPSVVCICFQPILTSARLPVTKVIAHPVSCLHLYAAAVALWTERYPVLNSPPRLMMLDARKSVLRLDKLLLSLKVYTQHYKILHSYHCATRLSISVNEQVKGLSCYIIYIRSNM